MSILKTLDSQVSAWAQKNYPNLKGGLWVRPATDERFGHFQSNLAMVGAKQLKRNPRELAAELVTEFESTALFSKVEIAGPGFVNLTLSQETIEKSLAEVAQLYQSEQRISPQSDHKQKVVVDFSSPNVAKEMHVGHIRSTILGDSISRTMRYLGHDVTTDNHIGDWGLQFGKILVGYKKEGSPKLDPATAITEMERLYKDSHALAESDDTVKEECRAELVKLQDGDEENNRIWQEFIDLSKVAFDTIYDRLKVKFDHTLGESFYNPMLNDVVEELKKADLAKLSEGAWVVFFDDNKELKNHPFLVQKSDGAALYATTDVATVKYRLDEWKADQIIYVTDGRQQLHFKQLFETIRKWGLKVEMEHAWFGAILGQDNKPIKTKEGTPIKLANLLDEAESRSADIIKEKRPELEKKEAKLKEMARVIGIAAVKYADLAQNRNLDYVFNWDRMLAFDGNTAPYQLNAYVRTRSILRRAGNPEMTTDFLLEEVAEQTLARKLLEFEDLVDLMAREHRPHHLCNYLYEVSAGFHRFFEHCPVLQAKSEELKQSRLNLCHLTGATLKQGLDLLGIEVLEEM